MDGYVNEKRKKEKNRILKKVQKRKKREERKEREESRNEAVKKGLQMGLGTIEQIAEMLGVSVDFVKQVQLSLEKSEKPEPKKHSKKAKPQ